MCVCYSAYYYPQCHWSVTGHIWDLLSPSSYPPALVALTCSNLFIGRHHAGTPLPLPLLLDSFMLILNKVHSIRNDEDFCPPLVSPMSTNNRSSYSGKCSCSAHYIRDFQKPDKINIIAILCENKNSSNKMLPRVMIELETSDSKSDTPPSPSELTWYVLLWGSLNCLLFVHHFTF